MDGDVFDQEWTGMDMNGEWTGMALGCYRRRAVGRIYQHEITGTGSLHIRYDSLPNRFHYSPGVPAKDHDSDPAPAQIC